MELLSHPLPARPLRRVRAEERGGSRDLEAARDYAGG